MVWGIADLHMHLASHLGFGRSLFFGEPDHPDGMAAAMDACEPLHGAGGTGVGTMPGVFGMIEKTGYGDGVGHMTGGARYGFDGWPRFTSTIHQQAHVDWIRRAHDGGLRLLVALCVNNELLAVATGGDGDIGDSAAITAQVEYIRAFADRHGDFLRVVSTPAEARRAIADNRTAIILGAEVDTLAGLAHPDAVSDDEVRSRIQALHALGLRYVFPVHLANNAFGGAAVYHEMFMLLQQYLRGRAFDLVDQRASGVEFSVDPQSALQQISTLLSLVSGNPVPLAQQGAANAQGLTRQGGVALAEMMRLGMLIDVDHCSQRTLTDILALAERERYPLMSGHTGFRELSWSRVRGETASEHKPPSETQKRRWDVQRIVDLGGMVAPILNQGDNRPVERVDPAVGTRVPECAGSSASWAQAYLYAVSVSGGRGVGFGSDINGLAQATGPRFGPNAAYSLDNGQDRDPVRRALRGSQVEAQRNGVRYSTPVRDWRPYRWREGATAEHLLNDEQRDMWQALAVVAAGCDPWQNRTPSGGPIERISERVRNFARGLTATGDGQLQRPGVLTGDIPWEQRTGFLLRTGQTPGSSERDPARVHELFAMVQPVHAQFRRMEGTNLPLARSEAGGRDFDINVDGFAHYGMLPDFVADLRNLGMTEQDLAPLFSSAEEAIRVWERALGVLPRKGSQIDLIWIATGDAPQASRWRGSWQTTSPIGDGRLRAGSPVTAVSRAPGTIDAFGFGLDGAAYATWWDGNWHPWYPIRPQRMRADSPLAALSRTPASIELFAVAEDGGVTTTTWDGRWRDWTPLGQGRLRNGSAVAALSRSPWTMDVFGFGLNGALFTASWMRSWSDWQPIGAGRFRTDSPIAAVSRKPGTIDLFAIGLDGAVYANWREAGWHDWYPIGAGRFRAGSPLSVVARKPDLLDLFAIGTDGSVYTTWWDGSWHNWYRVGAGRFREDSPLTVVARTPDHLDILAIGEDDRVYANWWDGNWHDWYRTGAGECRVGSPLTVAIQ